MRRLESYVATAKLPERDGEFEYHTKIPANCTNALRGKASFMRPADDARQTAPRKRRCSPTVGSVGVELKLNINTCIHFKAGLSASYLTR